MVNPMFICLFVCVCDLSIFYLQGRSLPPDRLGPLAHAQRHFLRVQAQRDAAAHSARPICTQVRTGEAYTYISIYIYI